MDWVQTYYLTMIFLGIFFAGFTHGEPKTGKHNAFIDLIGIATSLPIIGRVFNWW